MRSAALGTAGAMFATVQRARRSWRPSALRLRSQGRSTEHPRVAARRVRFDTLYLALDERIAGADAVAQMRHNQADECGSGRMGLDHRQATYHAGRRRAPTRLILPGVLEAVRLADGVGIALVQRAGRRPRARDPHRARSAPRAGELHARRCRFRAGHRALAAAPDRQAALARQIVSTVRISPTQWPATAPSPSLSSTAPTPATTEVANALDGMSADARRCRPATSPRRGVPNWTADERNLSGEVQTVDAREAIAGIRASLRSGK